jgi:hypothetical protein
MRRAARPRAPSPRRARGGADAARSVGECPRLRPCGTARHAAAGDQGRPRMVRGLARTSPALTRQHVASGRSRGAPAGCDAPQRRRAGQPPLNGRTSGFVLANRPAGFGSHSQRWSVTRSGCRTRTRLRFRARCLSTRPASRPRRTCRRRSGRRPRSCRSALPAGPVSSACSERPIRGRQAATSGRASRKTRMGALEMSNPVILAFMR